MRGVAQKILEDEAEQEIWYSQESPVFPIGLFGTFVFGAPCFS